MDDPEKERKSFISPIIVAWRVSLAIKPSQSCCVKNGKCFIKTFTAVAKKHCRCILLYQCLLKIKILETGIHSVPFGNGDGQATKSVFAAVHVGEYSQIGGARMLDRENLNA